MGGVYLLSMLDSSKTNVWAGKMAQQIKPLASKPHDLSLIPAMHLIEGENLITKVVLLSSTSELWPACVNTQHTHLHTLPPHIHIHTDKYKPKSKKTKLQNPKINNKGVYIFSRIPTFSLMIMKEKMANESLRRCLKINVGKKPLVHVVVLFIPSVRCYQQLQE